MRITLFLILTFFIAGCSPDNLRSFDLRSLAKSDIDMVADTHRKELDKIIRQLTIKFYKRNPRELAKTPLMTVDLRVQQILAPPPADGYPELKGHWDNRAIHLALTQEYEGDRVFALMVGIHSMIDTAFNNKPELFLLDELDQQKLYNSARNLETVAWQLNHLKDRRGQPLLLANGISKEGIQNLSFERLLGKMIGLQDMLALIIADTTNRNIKNVVHRASSMIFLPI